MRKIVKTGLLAALIMSVFVVKKAVAQNILPLMVAPVRQEIELSPGDKAYINVKFYNNGETPVTGILRTADFLVNDKEGSPVIIDDLTDASPKYSASTWVTLPSDRITIAAGDKVNVQASITVPDYATPGGRYLAIYFEPGGDIPEFTGTERAGSGVAARIASLAYIRIAGDIRENALITRFFAPAFFEYGPVRIETEILNRGDYHIRPKAILALTDMFGGLVDQVSLKERNIFPDTSLVYENELGQKWLFGKYKITLMGSYGNGKVLETSAYVWILPWRVIAIIILAVLILWLLIRRFFIDSKKHVSDLENRLKAEEDEIEKLKRMLKNKKD